MTGETAVSSASEDVARQARWRFRVLRLEKAADWEALYLDILKDAVGHDTEVEVRRAIAQIGRRLQEARTRSVIVEYPYHDRDYTDDYASYYSRIFRPGGKACFRYHFFTNPASITDQAVGPIEDEKGRLRALSQLGEYNGFLVRRPNPDAPIGRTVLVAPDRTDALHWCLKTRHVSHLFGMPFVVEGFPFIEQDAKLGSCAQASVWMALRYLSRYDEGPWVSAAALNAFATAVPDEISTGSLPAGSQGLETTSMLRAIRATGRQAFRLSAMDALVNGRYEFRWRKEQDPVAIACRYIDSGFPVILLVGHTEQAGGGASVGRRKGKPVLLDIQDGHALTAIGYFGSGSTRAASAASSGHVSGWLGGLIAHDDQGGPYLRLLRKAKQKNQRPVAGAITDYTTSDIHALIVPLPEKVFLIAEKAEELAREWIDSSVELWKRILQSKNKEGETSDFRPQRLPRLPGSTLIARTFLVRGYTHYRWLAESGVESDVLRLAALLHLPRFIWITEFYVRDIKSPTRFDRVVAHVVSDATAANATTRHDTFLFGHRPNLALALVTGRRRADRIVARAFRDDSGYSSYRVWKQGHAAVD